ncbi:MAG: serine/threonine-protein kinase [Gaiellaceae bacterium]
MSFVRFPQAESGNPAWGEAAAPPRRPGMPVDEDLLPERYRNAERIGHGAMGDIYRATDSLLAREVAVKVLAERYAQDAEIRERFTREALTAARLSGEPSIVTIFDVGESQGRPFIVMEYLPGGSLEQRLRRGVQDMGQALTWLEQAARALDAGHRHGIVHRDVKPGNLLLDASDNVHVADFGIASATGLDSLTMTGTVLGTAGYLAPEQASGDRAGPASDRYGLGVVAWELLAGGRPFASESPTAEAAAHVNTAVPSICERRSDLPGRELDEVFARALAKRPEDRYGSCAELVAALRFALAAGTAPTRVLGRVAPAAPARQRSPARWVVVAALAAAGLLAGALVARGLADGDETAPAPPPRTRVTTVEVTQPGTTVRTEVTVTAQPRTTAPTTNVTTTTPAAGGSIDEGVRLTDDATVLMNAGRYEESAAKAQEALRHLGGTGELYEAYALYDLGRSLIELGDCKQGVKYLKSSEKIQGHRNEIDAARARCD